MSKSQSNGSSTPVEEPQELTSIFDGPVGTAVKEVEPFATQIGFGVVAGYTSGLAMRTAGKVGGIAIGTGFIFIQGLSYLGYVDVDWRKVERDYCTLLDFDGDGKVTTNDINLAWNKVQSVLAFNLPAGTGFSAGLLYGMGLGPKTAGGLSLAYGASGMGARLLLAGGAGGVATTAPALVVDPLQRMHDYILGGGSAVKEDASAVELARFESSLAGMDITSLRKLETSVKDEARQATKDPNCSDERANLYIDKLTALENQKVLVKKSAKRSW
eukprot:CAMPEP_0197847468 /NCGR_PEP_ID=MMETSP1438-20131217/6324_1 /TAXON_ID=1461541 /ORGANISM="Pterosperma sp., Strain CCMP1384" /LENGTH=271 /DNA_ID=CAMNT_0043459401 /DNA_START=79 /DNA_END=891 /DNA_ORIENTATION=-